MAESRKQKWGLVCLLIILVSCGVVSAEVFTEDFSNPSDSEWTIFRSPNGYVAIEDGALHIDAAGWEESSATWSAARAQDFIYEFDYRQTVYDGWFMMWFSLDDNTLPPINTSRQWASVRTTMFTDMDGRGWWGGAAKFINGESQGQSWYLTELSVPRSGLYGTPSDGIWHHMKITRRGADLTLEITDTGAKATYVDCAPLPAGYIAFSASGYSKDVYFDNIRFETLDIPRQTWDANLNGTSDICEDSDGDGIPNGVDNCSDVPNTDQSDRDFDGLGDPCDPHPDTPDTLDQCFEDLGVCTANLSQCDAELATCETDSVAMRDALDEGHAGLQEIERLLSLPPGRRVSTYACSGALCPQMMDIIRMLLGPPGRNISGKLPAAVGR